MNYPRELRPQPNDKLLTPLDLHNRYLLRETKCNLYEYIKTNDFQERDDFNICTDELFKDFIDYPASSKDVYELSLYLYGVFNLSHMGLKLSKENRIKYLYENWKPGLAIPEEDVECEKDEGVFPVFFEADKLSYEFEYTDQYTKETIYTQVSFEHMPNLLNYWHFQLFATGDNERLLRNIKAEKYSRLAKIIIKHLFVKAVCLDEEKVLKM